MENLFTLEAVKIAVKLVAYSSLQLIGVEEAEELLNKLPEELQNAVAETVVKAVRKKRAIAYGAMLLALDDIEKARKEAEKAKEETPKEGEEPSGV